MQSIVRTRHVVFLALPLALGLSAGVNHAEAATIGFSAFYSNDAQMVTPVVTANDNTAGKIEVSIGISGSSTETGLLQAIWFDYSPTLVQSDLTVPVRSTPSPTTT